MLDAAESVLSVSVPHRVTTADPAKLTDIPEGASDPLLWCLTIVAPFHFASAGHRLYSGERRACDFPPICAKRQPQGLHTQNFPFWRVR